MFDILQNLERYVHISLSTPKEGKSTRAANRSEAAYCVVVAIQRHLNSFQILLKRQLMDVVHSSNFGPVLSVNDCDTNMFKISLDKEIEFGLGLSGSCHEKNFGRIKDSELMCGLDISVIIRDLT